MGNISQTNFELWTFTKRQYILSFKNWRTLAVGWKKDRSNVNSYPRAIPRWSIMKTITHSKMTRSPIRETKSTMVTPAGVAFEFLWWHEQYPQRMPKLNTCLIWASWLQDFRSIFWATSGAPNVRLTFRPDVWNPLQPDFVPKFLTLILFLQKPFLP